MPNPTFERKRQILEKRLAQLYEQYEAAYLQQGRMLGEADKVRVGQEIEHLEQEIEREEVKLQKLERVYGPRNRRHLGWLAHLPEIDFREAIAIFSRIIEQLEDEEGGAALFFLQNCHSMGGKWCIARLRGMLKTADFKHYEIEFSPETRLNEHGLLSRLGQYVGCEPLPEEQDQARYAQVIKQHAQVIMRKICDSLQSGSVVFIELKVWDTQSLEDRFLPWFLQDFWVPLVRHEWQSVAQECPMVKFIVLVEAHTPLATGSLPQAMLSPQEQFDREKILELPLRPWTLDEIRKWLFVFSGLTAPHIGLDRHHIKRMARSIYHASGRGQPTAVYTALMDRLEKHFG